MNIEDLYKHFLECTEVTTDTRKCVAGSMFFALKGETFNGNNFVPLKVLYSHLKLHAFLFFEQCRHIFNKFFDVPLVDQFSGLTIDFCQMEAAVIGCK